MAGHGIQGTTSSSSESDQDANLHAPPQREIPGGAQAMFDGGAGLQNQQLGEVGGAEENQDPVLPEKRHEESSSDVEHEKCDVQRSTEQCGQDSLGLSQTGRVAHLVATDMVAGLLGAGIRLSAVGSVLAPSAGESAPPVPASHSGSVVDSRSHGEDCFQGDSQGLSNVYAEHRVATTIGEGLAEVNIKLPKRSVVEPPPPKSATSKSDSLTCIVEETGSQAAEYIQGNIQGLLRTTTCVEHLVATAMKEGLHEVNKLPEAVSTVESSTLNSQSSSVRDSGSQASWSSYGDIELPESVYAEHIAATTETLQAVRIKLSQSSSVLEASLDQPAPSQPTSQPVHAKDSSLQAAECSQRDRQGLSHSCVENLVATAMKEGLQEVRIQISQIAFAENLVDTAMREGLQEASIKITAATACAENLVGAAMREGLQEARIQITATACAQNLVDTAMREGLQEASIQIAETACAENLAYKALLEGLQEASTQMFETPENRAGTATRGDEADSQGLPPTACVESLDEVAAIRDRLKEASTKLFEATSLLKTSVKLLEATSLLVTPPDNSQSSSAEDSGSQTPVSAVPHPSTVTEAEGNQDSVLTDQVDVACSGSSVVEQDKCDVGSPPVECVPTDELGISQTVHSEHLVSQAAREGLHAASIEMSEAVSVLGPSPQKFASPGSAAQSGSEDSSSRAAESSQGNSQGLSQNTEHLIVATTKELQGARTELSEAGFISETSPQSSNRGSEEDSDSRVSESSEEVSEGVSRAAYAKYLATTAARYQQAARIMSERWSIVEPFFPRYAPSESSSLSDSEEDTDAPVSKCSQGDSHELSQTASAEPPVDAVIRGLHVPRITLSEAVYAEHLVGAAIREGLETARIKLSEAGSIVEPSLHESAPAESSQSGGVDASSPAAGCNQGDNQGSSQLTASVVDLVVTTMKEALQEAAMKLDESGSVLKSPQHSSHPGSVETSGSQATEYSQGDNQSLSQTVYAKHLVATPTMEELQEGIVKLPDVRSVVEASSESISSQSTSVPGSAEDSRPQTLGTVSYTTTAEPLEYDQGDSPVLSQTACGEHFEQAATELLCVAKPSEASSLLELARSALPTTDTHSGTTSETTPVTESDGTAPQHSSGDKRHDICHSSHSETDESE